MVVAAIIIFTSIYFNDHMAPSQSKSVRPVPEKKMKPAAMVKKVFEKLSSKTFLKL